MTTLNQIQTFINRKRNRRKPLTYKQIAQLISDRYGDGSYIFSPGQLSLIMNGEWDPEPSEIRKAYGLGPRVCPHCGRKPKQQRHPQKPRSLNESEQWWRSLDAASRRLYIETMYRTEHIMQNFERTHAQKEITS